MSRLKYSVIKADVVAESETILAFWEVAGINSPLRQQKKYKWFYVDNPSGAGLAFWLSDNKSGEFVGIECIGVRDWVIDGSRESSGVFVDLIVHPSHRSLLPALHLIKNVAEYGRGHFKMVCGFPNDKSALLFRRANLSLLGQLVRYARVLRSRQYLVGRLPLFLTGPVSIFFDFGLALYDRIMLYFLSHGMKARWVAGFDGRFDQLWDSVSKSRKIMAVRDVGALEWRHNQCPDAKRNHLFALYGKNEILLGYIVCTYCDEVVTIRDFFSSGEPRIIKALFFNFIAEVKKLGCNSISLEFFGDPSVVAALESVGFRARGERPIFYALSEMPEGQKKSFVWYVTSSEEDM